MELQLDGEGLSETKIWDDYESPRGRISSAENLNTAYGFLKKEEP